MSKFKRREVLLAGLASMPIKLPFGPNPFDPRQPRNVMVPRDPEDWRQRPYTEQSPASPVHLTGFVVLRANTSGSVPAAALKNPMNQDMELLEIKFELSGPRQTASAAGVFGGTISCELSLGSHKITNGSVPCWNFGRAENLEGEVKSDTTDTLDFASFSWRLPRPLFIPAGAVVIPTFTHNGYIPQAVTVRVGYSCRTVFTKPKRIYVPWVAKYVSKAFNPLTDADTDLSSELDLVNSNPEVLHLQRLTGRLLFLGSSDGVPLTSSVQPMSLGAQYMTLRITDSYGRPIVRNYSTFDSVFNAQTRSWEMEGDAELDPEAYYLVNLKKGAMALDGPGAGFGATTQAQVFVGMVGWREMENP